MKQIAPILVFSLASALATGCIITTDDEDSSLTIENESSFVLVDVAVAEVGVDDDYGPNLLDDPLFPGDSITILLDCGTYDALIIDEDDFDCELQGLDLCFDDAVWTIDDVELATCGF